MRQRAKYILKCIITGKTVYEDGIYFEYVLNRCFKKIKDFFYVQIGANDGVTEDPLYQFVSKNHSKVNGIALEPMKDVFAQLQRNFRRFPNIRLVNKAIHNTEKQMTIYKVSPDRLQSLPYWSKGIASFNQNHHKLTATPSEAIVSETVECITFNELLSGYGVKKIDLLQIDTEGYDAQILSGLDFSLVRPAVIHFEHKVDHGTMSEKQLADLLEMLNRHGYQVSLEGSDATAYQPHLFTNG